MESNSRSLFSSLPSLLHNVDAELDRRCFLEHFAEFASFRLYIVSFLLAMRDVLFWDVDVEDDRRRFLLVALHPFDVL